MLGESPRWPVVGPEDWDEQTMGPRVIWDLEQFNHYVKAGDPIVVMKPDYLAVGRFARTTEGRFNLAENCIDLTKATVFPLDLTGPKLGSVATLLTMVGLEQKEELSVDLGNRDFLVYRYSVAET